MLGHCPPSFLLNLGPTFLLKLLSEITTLKKAPAAEAREVPKSGFPYVGVLVCVSLL